MVSISVKKIESHRNGISGEGFHAVVFTDREDGETRTMLGIVFPLKTDKDGNETETWNGRVAVFRLDGDNGLHQGCIAFGKNSWRGDHYESALREHIKERDAMREIELRQRRKPA